eukprot:9993507-Alexandrium_andersonii.AAC.1
MSASLVGSEMCIRDSRCAVVARAVPPWPGGPHSPCPTAAARARARRAPVSYTHLTLPTICSV